MNRSKPNTNTTARRHNENSTSSKTTIAANPTQCVYLQAFFLQCIYWKLQKQWLGHVSLWYLSQIRSLSHIHPAVSQTINYCFDAHQKFTTSDLWDAPCPKTHCENNRERETSTNLVDFGVEIPNTLCSWNRTAVIRKWLQIDNAQPENAFTACHWRREGTGFTLHMRRRKIGV